MGSTLLVNIITTVICVGITAVCYLRLATAAIATACDGDQLDNEVSGCTNEAILAAASDGPKVFTYIDGKVTGLASGFFYEPRQ